MVRASLSVPLPDEQFQMERVLWVLGSIEVLMELKTISNLHHLKGAGTLFEREKPAK